LVAKRKFLPIEDDYSKYDWRWAESDAGGGPRQAQGRRLVVGNEAALEGEGQSWRKMKTDREEKEPGD
jgi:hypothetical protein